MNNRVCVTGVGIVSSIGHGKKNFWDHLITGNSGITEVELFDTSPFDVHRSGEIKNFDPSEFKINENRYGRCSQLAIAACQLAVDDAGLTKLKRANAAVIIGTTLGETQSIEAIDQLWVKDEGSVRTDLIEQYPAGNIADNVADVFSFKGASMVIPNACAAGNFAISYAYDLIRSGDYDIVITGGAEAMSKIAFTGFCRIFAIAPNKCQPFDIDRKGIMVGEGAGMLVLESEEHVRSRQAKVYCYVTGFGLSADAKSMIIPDEDGIYKAMCSALKDAKVESRDVDYICAHGTGTKANDLAESKAICRLFGSRQKNGSPLVTSIKSMLGHTMGAASAIESISCVLSIDTGIIPPTINLEEQDPGCDIHCVANAALERRVNTVLNNAFAFGGNNSCVVFSNGCDR
ncbi:beta-ketoacyl-[acyl-carrier-protein] synthase family protein [Candidatus Uhrbacteria bacterium]|nr:beta-ketoacyl-[acyl-carrier-protein] synthase family protein [Candidatus Uhrbacteria bacterium]